RSSIRRWHTLFSRPGMRVRSNRLERGPHFKFRADSPDRLVGELGRPGVTAEVGRPHARSHSLETGFADRAADSLRVVLAVREKGSAGEDHRHRVRDVLAAE